VARRPVRKFARSRRRSFDAAFRRWTSAAIARRLLSAWYACERTLALQTERSARPAVAEHLLSLFTSLKDEAVRHGIARIYSLETERRPGDAI
jgi:hypothetical protein